VTVPTGALLALPAAGYLDTAVLLLPALDATFHLVAASRKSVTAARHSKVCTLPNGWY
jgi:hypothetical protein